MLLLKINTVYFEHLLTFRVDNFMLYNHHKMFSVVRAAVMLFYRDLQTFPSEDHKS